jgi:hypothetical protein
MVMKFVGFTTDCENFGRMEGNFVPSPTLWQRGTTNVVLSIPQVPRHVINVQASCGGLAIHDPLNCRCEFDMRSFMTTFSR